MSRIFLALGSITGIGIATASWLMPGKPSPQTPIAATPTQPVAKPSTKSSSEKTNSVLGPLLPSLSKPPTSLAELSVTEPKSAIVKPSPSIASPSTPAIVPKRSIPAATTKFLPKKSVSYITPRMTPIVGNSVTSQRFVNTPVAKFSSRRFTPFINPAPRLMSVPKPEQRLPLQPLTTPANSSIFQQSRPRLSEPFPYLNVPLQPIVNPSAEFSLKKPKPAVATPSPSLTVPVSPVTPSVELSPQKPKPAIVEPSPSLLLPIPSVTTPSFESSPQKPEPVFSPE